MLMSISSIRLRSLLGVLLPTMVACSSTEPPAVASVVVSPSNQSIASGATLQLTAKGFTESGKEISGRAVTWSATGTATVSPTGLVTAGSVLGASLQSATVTATIDGLSGSTTLSVQPVPIASISLQASASKIAKGDTLRISAVVKGANNEVLTDRSIQWSVDDTTIATITGSGVLQARKSFGQVTVRASAGTIAGTLRVSATCYYQPILSADVVYSGTLDGTDCPSAISGLFYDAYRLGLSSSRFATLKISNLTGAVNVLASSSQDSVLTGVAWSWDYPTGGSGSGLFLFGAGTWYPRVRTQVAGGPPLTYQLQVTTTASSPATGCNYTLLGIGTGLSVTRTLNECLNSSHYEHYYRTYLASGQTVTVTMSSATVDAFLCIVPTSATEWTNCNDDISTTDLNSRLVYTAPSSGVYDILATSSNTNETGTYQFGMTSSPVYVMSDVRIEGPTSKHSVKTLKRNAKGVR